MEDRVVRSAGTYYPEYVAVNESSARECGCDSGAGWVCERHRVSPYEPGQIVKVPGVIGKVLKTYDTQYANIERAPYTGIGGAPTRPVTMPTDAATRKQYPIATGFMDYFPDAILAIANLSWVGNQQHNPGKPVHWDRSKSADEADTTLRHFMERGTLDKDGVRHSVKFAWRALALLQKEIENELAPKSSVV